MRSRLNERAWRDVRCNCTSRSCCRISSFSAPRTHVSFATLPSSARKPKRVAGSGSGRVRKRSRTPLATSASGTGIMNELPAALRDGTVTVTVFSPAPLS